MDRHNPDHVAQVAAGLLLGRLDAEPHHIKQAVATARSILDEAYLAADEEGAAAAAIEPEPAQAPATAAAPAPAAAPTPAPKP